MRSWSVSKSPRVNKSLGFWPAVAALLAAALGGCATAPPLPPEVLAEREQIWLAHQAQVLSQDQWTLSGRVGISNEVESWQANLLWRQQGEHFEATMIGPLGQGTVRLTGVPGAARMDLPDGKVVLGASANELLARQLGWQVPADALPFWVRGVPEPGSAAPELTLNDQARLAKLEQGDWRIEYRRYGTAAGVDLPTKVFLENDTWRVRVAVDEWTLPAKAPHNPQP